MRKASREPVVGTSHVSHLTLSMEKGCRQEEDMFSRSARLELSLLL